MSRNMRAGALLAVGVALLGAAFLVLPVGRGLARRSYDIPFALRPDVAITNVLLIYLDDPAHQALHQPHYRPWDRTQHARLITNLLACGVRAIAFDILFNEPGPDAAADRALAAAIHSASNRVVLGAEFDKGPGAVKKLLLPRKAFRNAQDDNWGFVDFAPDPDRVVRRHFHLDPAWKDVPSLTWRLASQLELDFPRQPHSPLALRWVNYYGPPGSLPALSYHEALRAAEERKVELFQNRIVFVGAGSQAGYTGEERESFPTPYTRLGDGYSPGVEVHATTLLNLARGDWLRRLPPSLEFLVVVFLGAAFGFGLVQLRPVPAGLTALAGALGISVAALGLVWIWGWWFSWATIVLVELPAALASAVLLYAQQMQAPLLAPAATAGSRGTATPDGDASTIHVPDHQLLQRIGRGSYGEVWLARNVMGTLRAVKVVQRRAFGQDQQFEREFAGLKAFEPLSRLHEGLVDILHAGRNDAAGYFYYVMELADDAREPQPDQPTVDASAATATFDPDAGSPAPTAPAAYEPLTLRTVLSRSGRVPLPRCLQLGLALTSALDYLHGRSLLHRDLKPSNIIFVEGLPKLADIGLVSGVGEARSFVGTAGYIPPEGPGTPLADLYSLGMVLYEALTGWTHEQHPQLPEELESLAVSERKRVLRFHDLILRATESNPDRRVPSAQAMHQELLRLVG